MNNQTFLHDVNNKIFVALATIDSARNTNLVLAREQYLDIAKKAVEDLKLICEKFTGSIPLEVA